MSAYNYLPSRQIVNTSTTYQTYANPSNGSYAATNWITKTQDASSASFAGLTKLGMSSNGVYQLAVSSTANTLYLSMDNGATWTNIYNRSGLPGSGSFSTGSISADGKYILVGISGGYMYLSKDSGVTFANVNTNTPVVYLPFETTPVNGAIGGTTLTVTGSPALTQGIVGANAVNLANTAGGTATNYLSGSITPGNNFSVSLWFNLQSLPATNLTQSNIVSFGTSSQMIFQIMYLNLTGYTGFYVQYYDSTPSTASILGGYTSVNTNTWYNITCTFQVTGRNIVYINNTLVANSASNGISAAITTMRLGYGIGNTTSAFNGYIDDLKIYNTAIGFTPMVPMNYSYSAVSGTGQYMACAVASGGLFMSSNYGSTWSQVTSVIGTGAWTSLALSHTGQYMLANGGGMTNPNSLLATSNTWTANGVTWTASSSSNYPTYSAYGAFDNDSANSSSAWVSGSSTYKTADGTYNASVPTVIQGGVTSPQNGEWLQVQSSVPVVMYSYNFGNLYFSCLPKTYVIVGSNDGANWYTIQSGSISTTPFTANYTSMTNFILANYSGTQIPIAQQNGSMLTQSYSYASNAYTYFRIIVNTIFSSNNGFAELSLWNINFVGGQSYSTNYGGTWTNSLNTYVPNLTGLAGSTSVLNATTTWQTPNGVTWTSSASSALTVNYNAWVAFNNIYNTSTSPYSWAAATAVPGSITTTVLGGIGTVNGEWLQLQSSIPLAIYSYAFAAGAGVGGVPKIYYIVGSNDGTTWYPIQYVSVGTNPCTTAYNSKTSVVTVNQSGTQTITADVSSTFTITTYSTTTNSYTYFRLIVNTTFSANVPELNEWYINFVGGASTQINSTIATPTCLALSANGQYALGANLQAATLISNYLGGFGTNSSTSITLSGITANIVAAACSNTGAVMVLVTSGTSNNVYYSLNSGSTWTALTIGSVALTGCAVSYDGSYITVSNATNIYTLNSNSIGNSVALGVGAGATNQGSNTVAIGSYAGQTNQTANSIILNASGSALNSYTSGFYVAPIATALASTSQQFALLGYGADNQVVQSGLSFSTTPQTFYGEWIQLQLATAVSITSYSVYWRYSNDRAPVGYTLLGSNDQIVWTILDTQNGVSKQSLTNNIPRTSAYIYYRLVITRVDTAVDYNNIGLFTLYNGGNPVFGPSASYTAPTANTLSAGGVIVCTVTCSWILLNSIGISNDGSSQYSYIVTNNNANGTNGWVGFYHNRTISCYNTLGYAYQGTSTVANSSVLNGNIQVSGSSSSYTSGLLNITNTNTAPIVSFSVLGPNALNAPVTMLIGQSATQYNSFYLSYMHVGGGSTYNYLGINPYSNGVLGVNIAASGNVGIGITNPDAILHISGTTGHQFIIGHSSNPAKYQSLISTDNAGNCYIDGINQGVGWKSVFIGTAGTGDTTSTLVAFGAFLYPTRDNLLSIGNATNRWTVVYAVNGTIQTSDSSQKDSQPLVYGLNEIMQMRTILYKWKSQANLPDDDPSKNYKYYGFCADELSPVFPELVYDEDKSVPIQMNYSEIMPVMVNAIKELNTINQQHTTEIATLKEQMATVLARLA